MVEMRDVVTRLSQRTAEGGIPWKPTADESAFAATFGDMSLLLSLRITGTGINRSSTYKLSVLDEKGYEIDSAIYTAGFGGPLQVLTDMYPAAKRQALGVDERLQDLMSRLG